ncbi:MAG: M6 family metalloprotease domain-containing protein [Candidatus Fervidibacter sp.]|uniref:M6 family metalloprotease domain-containing protein n=1 Tax=Candidatus Fervidibacter sp. TaxID=3100871 RepID=UPI00404A265E
MTQPKLKWWSWGLIVFMTFVLVAQGFGQQFRFRCRTTEVTKMLMRDLGITEDKIRTFVEVQKRHRQAGRELPSYFYGGLGTSLYPAGGLVGTIRGLHILVRPNSPDIMPDPQHTSEYYRKLLFDESKQNSLASFVREASYGRCRLIGDSFGPVIVDVPVATTGNITYVDLTTPVLQSITQQVISALDNVVDFTRYDSDGDGRIDLLFLTIASDPDTRPPNGVFTQDPSYGAFTIVWGKMRLISPTLPPLATTNDGVVVDCAVFVHEVDSLYGCGTYAHEFGHVFGMFDLYNPNNLNQVDPGVWSLMSVGDRFYPDLIIVNPMRPGGHPGHFDPWCKLMLGWVTPVEITRDHGTVTIPAWSEQPVAYRLWAFGTPGSDEYFMVVNRQLSGFDRFLPGRGLNIFHIDRSIISDFVVYLNNAVQLNPSRKGVDLVDADGRNDMDDAQIQLQAFDWTNFGFTGFSRGNWGDDGDPFPGRTNNTNFNLLSTPSSLSYIGMDSGVRVLDIRPLADGTVQATLRVATQPQAVILGPRDGEIVYTRQPTLQVQFTAPMGAHADIDPASIEVLVDGSPVPIPSIASVFDEGRQTLILPLANLPSGTHTVEVKARNRSGVDITPASVTFTVTPFLLRALFSRLGSPLPFMVTLPYNFRHESVTAQQRHPSYIFGIPFDPNRPYIARWGVVNAAGQQGYLYSGEFVEFAPGRSYWVRLSQDVILAIDAPDLDRTQPFRIANEPKWDLNNLDVGWQQVGNPFPFPVNSSAVQVLLNSGQILSLSEAVHQGVIMGTVYFYAAAAPIPSYVPININDWVLSPFTGYWIYKRQPCSLVVLPTPTPRSKSPERKVNSLISLQVWSEGSEVPYQVSITSGTEKIPAPPIAPGMAAWAWFVREGQSSETTRSGELPLMEIPANQPGKWWLVVQSVKPNQTVNLRWQSTGGRNLTAILTDPLTHRSVVLKGTGEWKVTTDKKGTKQLLLSVGLNFELPLRIVNVKVTRMRGGGYIVSGRLTVPAIVRAEIRTLTGRLVKVLNGSGEPRTQVQFVWDGRSIDGQVLPQIPLLLCLSARDNLGRETQRVVVLR